MLSRITAVVNRIIEVCLAISFSMLIVIVFVGVIWRYVLHNPLVFVEELAVLIVCWFAFMGAAAAIREQDHLAIDFVVVKLPPVARKVAEILIATVMVVFLAIAGVAGVNTTINQFQVNSLILEYPRFLMYLPFPLFAAVMILYLIEFIVRMIRTKVRGNEDGHRVIWEVLHHHREKAETKMDM